MYLFWQARRILLGERGQYGHTFGGDVRHKGALCWNCKIPLQMLLCLDAGDPLVSVDRGEENKLGWSLRWVPVYYCPFCNSSDIQYTVKSDSEIEVLWQEKGECLLDRVPHPYAGYPRTWPLRDVRLELVPYNTMRILAWYALARLQIGFDVSDEDEALAKQMSYPFHQWGGYVHLFQPPALHQCRNKNCKAAKSYTYVIGVLWNRLSATEFLYDADPDLSEEWAQLLIDKCPECQTLAVYGRGT